MAIRLHHNPLSPHSRRVQITALELGLAIDVHAVDFAKGEHKAPEFLKHNPNGKVPVLEDGNTWLWESNAIMAYLCDKQNNKALYPTELAARADVNRWLFWDSAHFGAACGRLISERVLKPMMKQATDATLLADGEANFNRFAAVLNGQLEGKQWVTGSQMTIADFALATPLFYRHPAQMPTKQFTHLEAWLGRIEARDSFKNTQPKL